MAATKSARQVAKGPWFVPSDAPKDGSEWPFVAPDGALHDWFAVTLPKTGYGQPCEALGKAYAYEVIDGLRNPSGELGPLHAGLVFASGYVRGLNGVLVRSTTIQLSGSVPSSKYRSPQWSRSCKSILRLGCRCIHHLPCCRLPGRLQSILAERRSLTNTAPSATARKAGHPVGLVRISSGAWGAQCKINR